MTVYGNEGSLGKGAKKREVYGKQIRICRRRRTESLQSEREGSIRRYIAIAVMMAKRTHLFPFRTQKLSSFTPKVLAENCWEDR